MLNKKIVKSGKKSRMERFEDACTCPECNHFDPQCFYGFRGLFFNKYKFKCFKCGCEWIVNSKEIEKGAK